MGGDHCLSDGVHVTIRADHAALECIRSKTTAVSVWRDGRYGYRNSDSPSSRDRGDSRSMWMPSRALLYSGV